MKCKQPTGAGRTGDSTLVSRGSLRHFVSRPTQHPTLPLTTPLGPAPRPCETEGIDKEMT